MKAELTSMDGSALSTNPIRHLRKIPLTGAVIALASFHLTGLAHQPGKVASGTGATDTSSMSKQPISSKAEARARQEDRGAQADNTTDDWVVVLEPGQDIADIANYLGADAYSRIGGQDNIYVVKIPGSSGAAGTTRDNLSSTPGVKSAQQQVLVQYSKRTITDPLFNAQWHLDQSNDTNFGSPPGSGTPGIDANVVDAWNFENVDGSGVTIGIVDDGLQHTHPDLAPNYNANASWDYNAGNSDPAPNNLAIDRHGTSVAGVAAAADDSSKCGVGAAYNATLAGLQLIAGPVTDATTAAALSYTEAGVPDKETIDISSNSWGPGDDGIISDVGGAGPITRWIMGSSIANGRDGKGLIYVWAAGNGRTAEDNVNYDNYANQRFTIAIGAVRASSNPGQYSFYSEPGAALHISAPSNHFSGQGIRTTDLLGDNGYNASGAPDSSGDVDCNDSFGGTSSAAPLVAGIIALMLDANPDLGWRDVQHILAETAVKNDPADPDWTTNGAGFDINHNYGFGMVDAQAAVASAKTWTNVEGPEFFSSGPVAVNTAIPDGLGAGIFGAAVTDTINVAEDIDLEHVEVTLNASHTFRGDLEVVLTSPSGTQSVLAEQRLPDSLDNYNDWTFMTVRNWGESSVGDWTLQIRDGYNGDTGTLNSWELQLHGQPPGC